MRYVGLDNKATILGTDSVFDKGREKELLITFLAIFSVSLEKSAPKTISKSISKMIATKSSLHRRINKGRLRVQVDNSQSDVFKKAIVEALNIPQELVNRPVALTYTYQNRDYKKRLCKMFSRPSCFRSISPAPKENKKRELYSPLRPKAKKGADVAPL